MNRIQTLMVSIAVPAGAAVLAACGGSSGSSGSSGSTGAPPAASSSSSALVKTASVGPLGTVLVDGKGMTLYRFDADSNNPPASHCTGGCTAYWPPLLAGSGTPAVQGVSASMIGTVSRSDGSKQVTLDGWPLYTYSGDHAPGDANGQGLNASGAKWWAVTASGQKAGSGSGGSSSGPSSTYSTRGGY